MCSLTPSGSATGNPRNKAALAPGRSLMDWVRLCNSGKDMSGTKGEFISTTSEQLAKHNKISDAWLAIRGIVYNVTEYMSFHPGGEEELMRGVGTDATKLFNKVHPWVNYESLLKSCIVGRLKTFASPTKSLCIDTIDKPINNQILYTTNSNRVTKVPSVTGEINNSNERIFKTDWFQQINSVTLIFYLRSNVYNILAPPQVYVSLDKNKLVTICIENEINLYELSEDVRWPCDVKINQTIAEIRLTKMSPKLWPVYGKKIDTSNKQKIEFCRMKVKRVCTVTHDTKLIMLRYDEKLLHYLHVGHHVLLKIVTEDEEIIRPYTPVSPVIQNLDFEEHVLYFLIKEYANGKLSRKICLLTDGDIINMSIPQGTFNCMIFKKKLELVLFAAGSGITPMTSLILWTLNTTRLNVKLVYFNKTENDIIWSEQINKLAVQNLRFDVTHVLSQPSLSWNGEKGFVTEELVRRFLIDSPKECFVCVCGPKEFNNACKNYVKDCGYPEDNFHCFSG